MRFAEGNILKNPEDNSFALVVESDVWDGKLSILQFGPGGPYVREYAEYNAESIFELVDE